MRPTPLTDEAVNRVYNLQGDISTIVNVSRSLERRLYESTEALTEARGQNAAFMTSHEGESLGAFVARIVGENKKLKQELEDKVNDLSGQLDMQKAFMNAAITQRDEAYEQIAKLKSKLQIKKMKKRL